MNLSAALDGSPFELAPFVTEARWPNIFFLGISALIALVFVAYLFRCYFQEFCHAHRVRSLKRRARLKPFGGGTTREAVAEGCRRRRHSAMTRDVPCTPPSLDWCGLPSLIPSHDHLTLVWDTGRSNEGASPRLHLPAKDHQEAVAENRAVIKADKETVDTQRE
jgi:hypothetical protein